MAAYCKYKKYQLANGAVLFIVMMTIFRVNCGEPCEAKSVQSRWMTRWNGNGTGQLWISEVLFQLGRSIKGRYLDIINNVLV